MSTENDTGVRNWMMDIGLGRKDHHDPSFIVNANSFDMIMVQRTFHFIAEVMPTTLGALVESVFGHVGDQSKVNLIMIEAD